MYLVLFPLLFNFLTIISTNVFISDFPLNISVAISASLFK